MTDWTILCVDDTRDIRSLVRAVLERDGVAVRLASDGEEALVGAVANPPNAILLDVRLPGIDGIETLRRMRARASLARLPILVMTARGDPATIAAAMAAGADGVIKKPFAPDELRARVRSVAGYPPAPSLGGPMSDGGWLWPESRDDARGRLVILEEIARTMAAGEAAEPERRLAEAEAHRLAGALAIHGLGDGSRLAGQIEAHLRDDTPRGEPQQLAALVGRLRIAVDAHGRQGDGRTPEKRVARRRVLVVSDDPLLLGAVRALLEPSGLHVSTLIDASLVVSRLGSERPDLVLFDDRMPGVCGAGLSRALRNDPGSRSVCVLRLTKPLAAMVGRVESALRVSHGPHGQSAVQPSAITPEGDDCLISRTR